LVTRMVRTRWPGGVVVCGGVAVVGPGLQAARDPARARIAIPRMPVSALRRSVTGGATTSLRVPC